MVKMMLKKTTSNRIAPLVLSKIHRATDWFREPDLSFAAGATHPDPKVGIPLYGPRSFGTGRHKDEVHIGFIGTGSAVEHAQTFYERCAHGLPAHNADNSPFPGFMKDRGLHSELRMNSDMVELITRSETLQILGIRRSQERFETMLELLNHKMRLLAGRDHPLDHIVLVLDDELYRKCRSANYRIQGGNLVHRDLRRAFKALAMRFHKGTQILQESTTGLAHASSRKTLDHESVIAWNLFTGLYFKADGLPWGPVGLPAGTCFVGISFYRPLGEADSLRTSVVQAFDENGEGLVLRGHSFHWDDADGKSPHLTEQLAGSLMELILERYQEERKQLPRRVIVQKTSRFDSPERAGFEQVLSRVGQYDLMALSHDSSVRLVRAGQYPPLRGTAFTVGDISYLYTTGYIPLLRRFPHGHVPSPLQIADHVGDTPMAQLLRETMILTKMNWNSADLASGTPITIRFSKWVGEILREVPESQVPQAKLKYYV
jgi:hypothetical protein